MISISHPRSHVHGLNDQSPASCDCILHLLDSMRIGQPMRGTLAGIARILWSSKIKLCSVEMHTYCRVAVRNYARDAR